MLNDFIALADGKTQAELQWRTNRLCIRLTTTEGCRQLITHFGYYDAKLLKARDDRNAALLGMFRLVPALQ